MDLCGNLFGLTGFELQYCIGAQVEAMLTADYCQFLRFDAARGVSNLSVETEVSRKVRGRGVMGAKSVVDMRQLWAFHWAESVESSEPEASKS